MSAASFTWLYAKKKICAAKASAPVPFEQLLSFRRTCRRPLLLPSSTVGRAAVSVEGKASVAETGGADRVDHGATVLHAVEAVTVLRAA